MIRTPLIPFCLFLIVSISGCDNPPVNAEVTDVILDASIVRLGELGADERKDLNTCCRYIGVDPKGRKTFSPAQGYWVRLSIDNQKLATASLLNSCGPSLRPQQCDQDVLQTKIQAAFASREYQAMYGKGLTRFILYRDNGDKIDKTDKHDGQKIVRLKRENGVDHFTIGPVNIKPHTVSIFMSTSLQEFKYDLP